MSRNRTLATVFLLLSAIEGFVTAPILLSRNHDPPPTAVPVLILIFALASLAAAYGLRQRASWAVPLGIGSLALNVVGATISLFASSGSHNGAVVAIATSLIAITMLVSVRRE